MNELGQRALDLLEQIATALGTTVQELWPVLIQQAHMEAYQYSVWAWVLTAGVVLLILCAVICFVCSVNGEPDSAGVGVVCILLAILISGCAAGCHVGAYKRHNNPEYYAVEYLADIIGDMTSAVH